jgi:hypothetical protein
MQCPVCREEFRISTDGVYCCLKCEIVSGMLLRCPNCGKMALNCGPKTCPWCHVKMWEGWGNNMKLFLRGMTRLLRGQQVLGEYAPGCHPMSPHLKRKK